MLVLSRKLGEAVCIGGGISVTIVKLSGGSVRLGIDAPQGMEIVREELLRAVQRGDDQQEDADQRASLETVAAK